MRNSCTKCFNSPNRLLQYRRETGEGAWLLFPHSPNRSKTYCTCFQTVRTLPKSLGNLGSACKRSATISTTSTTSLEHITGFRPLCMPCIVSLSEVSCASPNSTSAGSVYAAGEAGAASGPTSMLTRRESCWQVIPFTTASTTVGNRGGLRPRNSSTSDANLGSRFASL
jgi:hypothetical protein